MDSGTLYAAPLLTTIAVHYKNRNFIADQLLKPVPVDHETFKYLEFDQEVDFTVQDTRYNQDGSVNTIDMKAAQKTGNVEDHGLGAWIDPKEEQQAGPGIPVQALKTERLTNGIMLRREVDAAAVLTNPATYGAQVTAPSGAALWSADTSDPGKDISDAADSMPTAPNTLVLARKVASRLRRHPKILDVTRYTQTGKVPWDALAAYFDVQNIIVGDAFKNTLAPGHGVTRAGIWGTNAILAYVDPGAGDPLMQAPTLGYRPYQRQNGLEYEVFIGIDAFKGKGRGRTFVKVDTSFKFMVTGALNGWLFESVL